ncbi:MAG: hypothetical protein WBB24_14405 [Maribacter sp.]
MNFYWITNTEKTQELEKSYLDLEYKLRSKITRFVLERLDNECDGDLSSFHFNVDMVLKKITISEKTPEEFRLKLLPDFDDEISFNCC